jgi:hypothetical protein
LIPAVVCTLAKRRATGHPRNRRCWWSSPQAFACSRAGTAHET